MRLPLLGVLLLLTSTPIQAATRIDLVLNESQPHKVAWPVTTGVPFPRGGLTSPENCLLRDSDGTECLLQARLVARWDGPAGSIRWLTIDFVAEPGRKYHLEYGPDVEPKRIASPLQITGKDQVKVATGALTTEFVTDGPAALGPVRIDRNGDGRIQADEIVAQSVGEQYLLDPDGNRSNSSDDAGRKVVVESTGPVRACVRVDGHYTDRNGQHIVAYRTRYHFFAGLSLVKIVNEFRIEGSTANIRWKDIGFSLRLPLARDNWKMAVDASGDPGNQVLAIVPGKETHAVSMFQAIYRHYGNPECRGGVVETLAKGEKEHRQAERVGEWMQTCDDKIAVTGSMRWFWQQFPAEWEATPDGLTLHLWSPRGGQLDFSVTGIKKFFGEAGGQYLMDWKGVRTPQTPIENFFYFAGREAINRGDANGQGTRKHHEFYLHFGRANQAEAAQEYGRLAGDPPLALATAKWNCSTDVMGPIAARPNDAPAEKVVDRLFDLGREMQDTFGDYGWWLFGAGPHYSYQWDAKTGKHYADPRRFDFHTYQRDTQHWWNYLRSGERKFFDWALPAENHWVDIAVAHEPTTFVSEYRGGKVSPAKLNWPRGDWSIDSTVHFLRHHDTGEAWLRGQAQFWASYHRTLETTTLAYYLTGDERFNDVIDYWKTYWGDLAGKTSASKDFQPWHRQQAWIKPTTADEKTKSWAEMLRDYAPFNSGSRHQLTLLFNLSTLYEHTWDPKIKLAVKEYGDAFIDPKHPIGVWRSQENREPAHAEAPIMAHFWVPALWRYARATGDPRIPEVFRRYFDASLGADPFQEDIGVYSNVQIGYAYAFTKDPRHLRPAQIELEEVQPFAGPLAKPEDLGQRLYNPYAPIRSYTGIPRLVWALEEAKRNGVAIPPAVITHPQRTLLAMQKQADVALEETLWGYDREVTLLGPDGKPFKDFKVETKTYASAIQPFDRIQPKFEVFVNHLTIAANAPAGWYVLANPLETAILDMDGGKGVRCNAALPVAIHPGVSWYWTPPDTTEFLLETGQPKDLRVVMLDGQPIASKVTPAGLTFTIAKEATVRLENSGTSVVWVRIKDIPAEKCWLTGESERVGQPAFAPLPANPAVDAAETFTRGRFGKGVSIIPGRSLRLPDHKIRDGAIERFFDMEQGTLEFWVKRRWDDRLSAPIKVSYLTNGLIDATIPWKLPLNEWAHVALVWRPFDKGPQRQILHIYVNGLDQANYRSTQWAGYGDRPFSISPNGKWVEGFLSKAPPGTAFELDELRVSNMTRYADLEIEFCGQQTYNPIRFSPPTKPFSPDRHTTLLFHFDDDLKSDPYDRKAVVEGRWEKMDGKKK
ncbi:MAG: LamG domain-containing protein [Planctomycetes bacterium]|nr:LamG domain-containing protein [Planctomycetota bacterium]